MHIQDKTKPNQTRKGFLVKNIENVMGNERRMNNNLQNEQNILLCEMVNLIWQIIAHVFHLY